jgi:AcrR family transcriptional regulator
MTSTTGRRAAQAAATRTEILGAARRLFADRGFARTNIRDVAAAAGVSPQTVYDSVGSKRALVAGLNDLIDSETQIGALVGPVFASGDPDRLAGLPAAITRAIVEQCGDIVRTLVAGAAAEPELAAVLAEGLRRHRGGAAGVAAKLSELGALPDGSDVLAVGEGLAALTDAQYAILLVDDYGWSLDRVEEWMADACRRFALRQPH